MSNVLQVALPLVPLLLLLASLLLGRYPGCDAIVRLAERFASSPRRRSTGTPSPRRANPRVAVAGGLLIACGLASRPPPLSA